MKIIIIAAAFLSIYCNELNNRPLNAEDNNINVYHLGSKEVKTVELQNELREISGLAVTGDGKLLAHNDEEGKIFELDTESGKILRTISPETNLKKDFEGIASVGDELFLITSAGVIYQYKENEGKVNIKEFKTGLKAKNDVEGFCYNPSNNSLLILCKEDPGNETKNVKAVYSFNLDEMKLNNKPSFLISLTELKDKFKINRFLPSGIEYNPTTETYFVISSRISSIIELSGDGKIINAAPLPDQIHKQPEGITFLQNNTMVISNEGGSGNGTLTFYPAKKMD